MRHQGRTGWTATIITALLVFSGCAPVGVSDPPPVASPAPATETQSVEPTAPPATTPAPTSEAPPTQETAAPPASDPPPPPPEPTETTEDTKNTEEPPQPGSAELVPGSNHIASVSHLAHPAAEVAVWMTDPTSAPGKLLFLTFDDGPNTSTTPQVLDTLAAHEVPATFFIQGNVISRAPEVLQRTVAEGHAIALHSWSHDYSKLYPGRSANADRVAWEFDTTLEAAREVLGPDFNTGAWRYPGGHMSWKNMAGADAALAERGVTWLDWNAMTGDAEPKSRRPTTVEAMVALAVAPIADEKQVVVMLAHDSKSKQLTVDSLPQIIDAYKAAGYTFGIIA